MEQDIHAPGGPDGPAARRPRRRLPRHQPLRPARPRARLRLVRDLGRPGHHRHLRGQALRARRLEADDRLDELPLPRRMPADRRARAGQLLDPVGRRHDPVGLGDAAAPSARSSGSSPTAATINGKPYAYTQAARDLLPRGRLGARLRRLQQPGEDGVAAGVHAGGVPDPLHVQLVLHRQQAHRLLQLRDQPGALDAGRPDLPTLGEASSSGSGFVPPSQALLSGGPIDQTNVDPRTNISDQEPCTAHPQVVDQPYLTSWNNKQARGFRASDDEYALRPGLPLDPARRADRAADRAARRRSRRAKLVDAMEDAGTVDLRGDVAAAARRCKVIGNAGSPEVQRRGRDAARLDAQSGAHRRDKDADGVYDQAEAVRIMDAWWPRWVEAEFKPTLGGEAVRRDRERVALPRRARPDRLGLQQRLVRLRQQGPADDPRRRRSAAGSRASTAAAASCAKCRKALVRSLERRARPHLRRRALPGADPARAATPSGATTRSATRATGAITQPPIHWINRPTFQQVVQIGEQP